MKNVLTYPFRLIAKVFLGKGLIDKYFPALVPLYQKIYLLFLQKRVLVVSIPEEGKLKVNNWDIGVGIPLLLKGGYERKETELFLENIKKGMIVVDVGANIGYYTVLAAKKVGEEGKVFSFEPDTNNRLMLKENIALNKLQNVIIESFAISDHKGKVPFVYDKINQGGSSVLVESNKGASDFVLATTIDDYFKEEKNVDILKIDIEGSEIAALVGAKSTISRNKNLKLFIEYNPRALKKQNSGTINLVALIESYGFKKIKIIDEAKGLVLPLTAENLELTFRKTSFCNLYCEK